MSSYNLQKGRGIREGGGDEGGINGAEVGEDAHKTYKFLSHFYF